MNWRCFFWLHEWTRWTRPKVIAVIKPFTGEGEGLAQVRECRKCGKTEMSVTS